MDSIQLIKSDGIEKYSAGLQRSPTNKILARSCQQEQLDPWLEACLSSGISKQHTFAEGLQQEYSVTRSAVTQPVRNLHRLGDDYYM